MVLQGQEEFQRGIHYEVDTDQEPIGVGGTGVVYRGIMIDEKSGVRRDVAIKFLYNDLPESAIERSRREATIHIVHENLVEMLGFVHVQGRENNGNPVSHYHVVSELLNGVMLLDMLKEEVPDSVYTKYPRVKDFHEDLLNDRNSFALKVVRCVLSGIMALHDNGYIHRDIDPSNVMITESGKVKLIDLGICKQLGHIKESNTNLTSVGQFVGKAAYAAPELVCGDLSHQNATTDIYAIGILLYQIITGKLPFQGAMNEVLEKQLKEVLPLQPIRNKQIRKIVKKATEKNQNSRYQSAAEFRVALDNANGNARPDNMRIKKIIILSLVAVLIVSFVTGGVAFLMKNISKKQHDSHSEQVFTIANEVNIQNQDKVSIKTNPDESLISQILDMEVEDLNNEIESESTIENDAQYNDNKNIETKEVIVQRNEPTIEKAFPKKANSDGVLSLSYGQYKGCIVKGYPEGQGRLVYNTDRVINKYDKKQRLARDGDYVEGEFYHGFFISGKHYNSNNELIEKIMFGSPGDNDYEMK